MLLLYCMTKSGTAAPRVAGVAGAEVRSLEEAGIAAWYSVAAPAQAAAREDALAFHRVVAGFFAQQSVVPFRMPTLLADEAALRQWLAEHAAAVARELDRLRGVVQMELNITAPASPAPASGRAYLEARRDAQRALEQRAGAAREALAGVTAEWRQRETRAGIRCYALVPRDRVPDFVAHIDVNGKDAAIRVTGPWPPAEFLDPALTMPA